MAQDYYQTLGVSKNASADEIKTAYRKLAKQYHPDVNKEKGAEEKFKEVSEAYQILTDPKKKQAYDQYRSAAFEPGAGFPSGSGGGRWQNYEGGDFGFGGFKDPFEIFEQFFGSNISFGRNPGSGRKRGGRDLILEMAIDFMSAIKGGEKEISYQRKAPCPHCQGTGAQRGEAQKTCPQCNGQGQVQQVSRTIFGQFATVGVCPTCQGEGKIIEKKCQQCKGLGRVNINEKMTIKIPAGVDNGMQMRFAGKGESGERGGPSGDLYLHFKVLAHPKFVRQGQDIYLDQPISFSQAALGDIVSVETVDGTVDLKIPESTQSHTVFRLKAKGASKVHSGGRGDQYVKVIVKTPERLNRRQKELLEELKRNGE